MVTELTWHKSPEEAAALYSETDPTYSIMPDGSGRFYSVRDILNRAAESKKKRISKRLEEKIRTTVEEPFWHTEDGGSISPRQVLNDIENPAYASHKKRIENADLSYPTLLRVSRGGKRIGIIDGAHRLAKYLKEQEEGKPSSLEYRPVTANQIRESLLASLSTKNRKEPVNELEVMGRMLNTMDAWKQAQPKTAGFTGRVQQLLNGFAQKYAACKTGNKPVKTAAWSSVRTKLISLIKKTL
jgi:hypothetical protein